MCTSFSCIALPDPPDELQFNKCDGGARQPALDGAPTVMICIARLPSGSFASGCYGDKFCPSISPISLFRRDNVRAGQD
ncbi:hypothetical protein AVEN_44790-1 [Araneus ventricosus]|uniref:Uncharacterized protein n=1 Tax=Araneus ventricosus TaxID=182803 RepID=A0A4Y2TDG5_ARAVE|nr:hypothetical protein AVEN_44790-1 [Araneus ventricosus]